MSYEPLREYAQRVNEVLPAPEIWATWGQGNTESDPKRARELLERLLSWAEAGSKVAMCMSAARLRSSQGIVPQHEEAIAWARRAAAVGYPPGMFELGRCHEEGVGVAQDPHAAIQLYEKASAAGYAHAALTLAICYHLGQSVNIDSEKGLHYINRAVTLGDTYAPFELATWYEHGVGVPVDVLLARHWYTVAAESGGLLACLRLSTAYSVGELGLEPDSGIARRFEELSKNCSSV